MVATAQTMTNVQLRNAFLAAAVERSQILPRQAYADGGVLDFPLPKAGYGNYVLLDFQGTLTVAGSGGTFNLSPKAPFNIFKMVNFDDYLGTTRIACSGYKLYEREISTKYAFDPQNAVDTQAYSATIVQFSIGTNATTPVDGTYPWNMSVIVPIALHHNTTEGSFPFTLPEGQNMLSVQLNTLVGANNDNVIKQTAAGMTFALTGTVGATYYYWDVPAGTPIPSDDFQLIHELREIRQTDNIVAGVEKQFTLPTGRTFCQIIQDLYINDQPDTTDVTEIRFIVDGNTPTLDEKLYAYLRRNRTRYGRDWPVGMFLYDFWKKPWSPSQYGSLQTGLTLASTTNVTGNSYISILLESLYRTSAVTTG